MEPEIDKILATGQESTLYEAPKYCWSFLYFYYVNLKGPNKMIKPQKKLIQGQRGTMNHILLF